MLKQAKTLEKTVYAVPEDIDREIARLKLEAMGIKIDVLTEEQKNLSVFLGNGNLMEFKNRF